MRPWRKTSSSEARLKEARLAVDAELVPGSRGPKLYLYCLRAEIDVAAKDIPAAHRDLAQAEAVGSSLRVDQDRIDKVRSLLGMGANALAVPGAVK